MFKRVLIANRGEIANRIISTCLDLGIETVAIYSDDDRSLHYLNRADHAYRVGQGPVSSSYKNKDAILAIAKMAEADCIHAGYGFLSEDAEFAKACSDNKIEFIGSNYDVLKKAENKLNVKTMAEKLGIKTVPSSKEIVKDAASAKKIAKELGYPVMIKPVSGSHARGIRRVDAEDGIEKAFASAKIEAGITLTDDSVLVEKVISNAKHIEVPVLRDKGGRVLVLPELDCSIQRRYLKIFAETPAPTLDDKTRKTIKEQAAKLAEGISLAGLASFEFLVNKDGAFFLEVNPRLSVEHSITEMVTGFDLVKYQFMISAGEKLEPYEKELRCRGTGIQCRIYAEDPETYEPYTGVVNDVFVPMGPQVRHELVAHSGWNIPIHYDHMLAKMSVWGNDRKMVVTKMTHLLKDYFYSGIITNIPLQRQIFGHEAVLSGTYDIDFMRTTFVFNRPEPPQNFKTAMMIASAVRVYKTEEKRRGEPALTSNPISTWQKEVGTGRL
jgi:acetyl-CoA carboxylase, biotin carboxylase subunit